MKALHDFIGERKSISIIIIIIDKKHAFISLSN